MERPQLIMVSFAPTCCMGSLAAHHDQDLTLANPSRDGRQFREFVYLRCDADSTPLQHSGLVEKWVPGTSPGMTPGVVGGCARTTRAMMGGGREMRRRAPHIQCHRRTWSEDPSRDRAWRSLQVAGGVTLKTVLRTRGTMGPRDEPEDDTAGWGEAVP
jgi:hypothetical protein